MSADTRSRNRDLAIPRRRFVDIDPSPRWPSKEIPALMRTCCEWIQQLGTYQAATEVLEPD